MLRPSPTLLAALLLALGGRAASAQTARTTEPLVAVARAVPPSALLRQARLLGRQDAATPVRLALTLPLRNQGALRDLLRRLYDPKDPAYGHYLTGEQFDAQFAPTAADYAAVVDFARARGLTVNTHSGRTLVDVSSTSGAVEAAFGVHLNRYRLEAGRVAYANDAAPVVPASVAARIGGIVGLDSLTQPRPALRRPSAAQALANAGGPVLGGALLGSAAFGNGPAGGLSPSDIKAVYNLKNIGLAGEGQSVGLVELDGYSLSDIAAYNAQFGLGANLGILSNIYVGGYDGTAGTNQSEVVLDIDMMLSLVPKAQHIYVYETSNSNPTFLGAETQVADDDLAKTISCSFGEAETALEAVSEPVTYEAEFNAESAALQRMAAQGQSFFCSAGDNGAYTDTVELSVDDPANQPYATAVGGTTLSVTNPGEAQIAYGSETAWGSTAEVYDSPLGAGGGGGYSNYFLKPFYQYTNAASVDPTGPLGVSASMRDLPDVSLNADPNTGYDVFVAADNAVNHTTGFETIGGTSAAAPLWAAFTALVNEARATGSTSAPTATPGTPTHPVGFINPLIYQIGAGKYGSYANDFHDVTTGNNLYYPAAAGFDDATGWGSFNGANLLADLAVAGNPSFTGASGHVFPAGLALVSAPSNLAGLSLPALFGQTTTPASEQLILWQPALQQYAFYPTAPADTIRPGVGYWLRVPAGGAGITLSGSGSAVASPFTLTLQRGWNQIGDPFTTAVPFAGITVTPAGGGAAVPLTQASTLVSPILYTYSPGATTYTEETGQLVPYAGYWVYAHAPVTLTLTSSS